MAVTNDVWSDLGTPPADLATMSVNDVCNVTGTYASVSRLRAYLQQALGNPALEPTKTFSLATLHTGEVEVTRLT